MRRSVLCFCFTVIFFWLGFTGPAMAGEKTTTLEFRNYSSNTVLIDQIKLNGTGISYNWPARVSRNCWGDSIPANQAKAKDTVIITGSIELLGDLPPTARTKSAFTANLVLKTGSQWTSGSMTIKVSYDSLPSIEDKEMWIFDFH